MSWDTWDASHHAKDMDKPRTIVHTEASVSLGGQGLRILAEALWMRDRGHRLVIIAPVHSRLLEEAQRVGLETSPILFAKHTQGRDFCKLVGDMRRIAPDILNTHSSIDTWVGCLAGRLCGVPAIIRTRHLGTLLQRFTLPVALAAYNAGEAAVLRFGGIPPFPEKRAYVARVLALLRPPL